MKHKFSSMGRVAIALVLALSLVLVMGVPVSAVTAGVTTVAVAPSTINTAGQYTITIDTTDDLSQTNDDDIRIVFPEGTEVPAAYVDSSISINGTDVVEGAPVGVDVLVDDVTREFIIDVPGDVTASADVVVVFKTIALIVNPDIIATDYTLLVSTSEEVDSVLSAQYAITAPEGPVDRYSEPAEEGDPLVYEDSYTTITSAIAAVVADDTLKVHAGIYDENVIIDEDITLESYDGAATTTIDASALTDVAAVAITASGVTLGGDGVGFTIKATEYDSANAFLDTFGIHLTGPVDDVTIEDNVISGGNLSPQLGILIGTFGEEETYSGIHILSNALNTTWNVETAVGLNTTCGAIKSWPTTILGASDRGLLIDDNDITGFTVGMNLRNLQGTNLLPAVISNNTVYSNGYNGIEVSLNLDYLEIRGNHIYDNGGNGVAISDDATEANEVKVEQNDIHDNGNGVKVYDGVGSVTTQISINYNDIYTNTNTTVTHSSADPDSPLTYENYGVFNACKTGNTDLDAKYNFWGQLGGPNSATYTEDQTPNWWGTALGTGDIVGAAATDATNSATVIYNPWLSVTQVDVIDEGIRYYGSDTLTLQAGWNTLSVPLKLYDLANSIAEIEGMGDFLTLNDNYSGVTYRYDPVEGWLEPTTLIPCEGYYIKMLEDSNFPVLYSNSLGLPALELTAGWNLIGSAFGIDKLTNPTWAVDDPDTAPEEAEMDAALALDSIKGQVSVVVSPSAPGQIGNPWSLVYSGLAGTDMYTGEGYWVFMTDTGTLAGFEITPFYFAP